MAKTSMNLEENIAGVLCYLLTWLTGIVFYFVEKENKTVRFHAMQSILTFLPLMIIAVILGFVGAPSIGYGPGFYSYTFNPGIPALVYLSWLIYGIIVILWLILIIMTYQGKKLKLPFIGDIAEKHA